MLRFVLAPFCSLYETNHLHYDVKVNPFPLCLVTSFFLDFWNSDLIIIFFNIQLEGKYGLR
jgi:hypothetical protein